MTVTSLPAPVNGFTGLMRDIFDDCHKQATNNPWFALACTLQLMAALGQRTYVIGGCDPDSMNLYQLIVAPPASGKGAMINWLRKYIAHAAPDIEGPEWASKEAGRATLTERPSQLHVIDELATKWKEVYAKNVNPQAPMPRLVSMFLDLHASVARLPPVTARKAENCIAACDYPRVSLVGFTTPGEMNDLRAQPRFVSGGMESRFLVWEERGFHIPELTFFRGQTTVNPALVTELRNFYEAKQGGMTVGGPDAGRAVLRVSEEINTYAKAILGTAIVNRMKDELASESEVNERMTSLRMRYYGAALKIAAMHCAGNGRMEVSVDDMKLGCAIAVNRMESISGMLADPVKSVHDAAAAQVLFYLEKRKREGQPVTEKRWLAQFVPKFKRLANDDERIRVLDQLARMGDILIEGKRVRLREDEAESEPTDAVDTNVVSIATRIKSS